VSIISVLFKLQLDGFNKSVCNSTDTKFAKNVTTSCRVVTCRNTENWTGKLIGIFLQLFTATMPKQRNKSVTA